MIAMLVTNTDFVGWLEQNWFIIGLFISFGGFVIKTTNSFDKLLTNIKSRDEELDKKIDERNNKLDDKLDKSFEFVSDRLDANINDLRSEMKNMKLQINDINDKIQNQEEKRLESLERTRIIMTGVEATLISLHNEGHNGPVTASLNEIENYKRDKSVQ